MKQDYDEFICIYDYNKYETIDTEGIKQHICLQWGELGVLFYESLCLNLNKVNY